MESGIGAEDVDAWIVLANPLRLDTDRWLASGTSLTPASRRSAAWPAGGGGYRVCRDGAAIAGEGLALGLSGGVKVRTIVSQGCRPIGEPLTITGAKENLLLSLGSKPAYAVLNSVFNSLTEHEKARAQGNLFAGLAMSEYLEDHKRGDFLIRNILGADPEAGTVAVGAACASGRPCSTSSATATAPTRTCGSLAMREEDGARPFASLVFSCNGRGRGLFRRPTTMPGFWRKSWAASERRLLLQGRDRAGRRANHLHGYTASVALLCDD